MVLDVLEKLSDVRMTLELLKVHNLIMSVMSAMCMNITRYRAIIAELGLRK